MAFRLVSALVAGPLAVSLAGCGGAGPSPAPPVEDPSVRILEWVASNDVDIYRSFTTALIEPTQAEPGCLHFDVYEDIDPQTGKTRIWQYLVFADTEAHQTHLNSDVVQQWIYDVLDPGNVTSPNESSLVFMKSLKTGDLPADCVEQQPGLYALSEFIATAGQEEKLKTAALELVEPVRATEGVLYYELLLPVEGNSFVQEIMWLKDEAALVSLRASPAWTSFTDKFKDPALTVKGTRPTAYTMLPACSASAFI